jgi:hypothetical protein
MGASLTPFEAPTLDPIVTGASIRESQFSFQCHEDLPR